MGGILGGLGIFKAGRGIEKSAKSLAASTADTMAHIRQEVSEIKEHLLHKVWPRVNETLAEVDVLVKEAQTFMLTGTFTVKVLSLLLIVCILYLLWKQMTSVQWHRNTYRHYHRARPVGGDSGAVVLTLESIIIQFIFWICLLMAFLLVLHLLQEVLLIANVKRLWPANIPFIIIIPSFAGAAVILQHMKDIIYAIASAIKLIAYVIFGLPLSLSVGPAVTGKKYAQTSNLLFTVVLITLPFLYISIAMFPLLYLQEVFKHNLHPLELALLVYLVFFDTAIVVHILGNVVKVVVIQPLWDCWARRIPL